MADKLKPFAHRLTNKEIKKLLNSRKTWGWLLDNYRQPLWCNYPRALEGKMGCWRLMLMAGYSRRIRKQADCKNCVCNKDHQSIEQESE